MFRQVLRGKVNVSSALPARALCTLSGTFLALGFVLPLAFPAPPEYSTFGREQRIEYAFPADDLLRVWVVYVDQGDGILIQLPSRYNYDPSPSDDDPGASERLDVMVDGGSSPESEAWRMEAFLKRLYSPEHPTIEHVVVSHHDGDHIEGIMKILQGNEIAVENIYHNGLASYAPGKRGFPVTEKPLNAVFDWKSDRLTRGMAFLEPDGITFQRSYLIPILDGLRSALSGDELHGIYTQLASAITLESDPGSILSFSRAYSGAPFITEREGDMGRGTKFSDLSFEVLWPLDPPRKYGGWSETINGNSVTFRLTYRDFQMLFTGDQNEKSEADLLKHLEAAGKTDLLNCDVLKVPHHGSSHALKEFFLHPALKPILSVASMGKQGFKSKTLYSGNWQHPATEVIAWLGGSHRVYHTLIHERRFDWGELRTEDDHEAMREPRHLLIETDGRWFRLVEVADGAADLKMPPGVAETRRGNGTRWIKATGTQ